MRKLLYCILLCNLLFMLSALSMLTNTSRVVHAATFHAAISSIPPGRGDSGKVSSWTNAHYLTRHGAPTSIELTFDDGPNPIYTPLILHILARYHIHATFFTIGRQVQSYPSLVRQEYQQGDVVGNHSWNHPNLTRLTPQAIRTQLQATSFAIQRATGASPLFFRPPYGSTNTQVYRVANQLGLKQILWTIDTRDWQRPGVNQIVHTVLTQVTHGSIILLHDGGGNRSQTVQALPLIITGLLQRGFTCTII